MVRRCVFSRNLVNDEALAHWGGDAVASKKVMIQFKNRREKKELKIYITDELFVLIYFYNPVSTASKM